MKRVREAPQRYALLFEDEGTFYRQPTQAWLGAHLGKRQPRLPYSHRSNTRMRVVAYLDATTGAVHSQEMARVSAARLADPPPPEGGRGAAQAASAGGSVASHLRPVAEPDGEGVAVDSTTGDPCSSMV